LAPATKLTCCWSGSTATVADWYAAARPVTSSHALLSNLSAAALACCRSCPGAGAGAEFGAGAQALRLRMLPHALVLVSPATPACLQRHTSRKKFERTHYLTQSNATKHSTCLGGPVLVH
jgi:hypothetical protein